jgi:hypothetical protein
MTMASIPRNNRGRRLRLAVAGAAVLTALTVATAGAVVAAPPAAVSVDITRQLPAPAALAQSTSLPSADLGLAASRQTPADANGAFLRSRKGRFTPLGGIPGAAASGHVNINNRGQTVGFYLDAQGVIRSFVKDWRGG